MGGKSEKKSIQDTHIHTDQVEDASASKKSKYLYFSQEGDSYLLVSLKSAIYTAQLLFGYDQGVMSSLLTLPTFYNQFPQTDTTTTVGAQNQHNSTIQGVVVGIYEIGCLFGALWTGLYLSDRFGRRKAIFVGSIWMIIGAAIQASSFGIAQLIVGRVVTGIGNGHITATVPTYQSECSRPERRGRLVMIASALITGGVCLSYWIDFACYWIPNSSADWRLPVAIQVIFAVFLMTFCLSLPESPRWLVAHGQDDEAAAVFSALENMPPDHPWITAQIKSIKDTLQAESSSVADVFKNGKQRHFHRAALGFINQMFQQISGINILTYYSSVIFQNTLGLSPTLSRILGAANGTEYFAASWIAVWTIERRKLMLFGVIGQAGTMAILAGCAYKADQGDKGAGIAAVVFLFVFNTFFAIGWHDMALPGREFVFNVVLLSLISSVVSTEVRAVSNGFSTASNWIFNFLVVMITPVMFSSIGYKTWIVWCCVNAGVILPGTWFFFPETAGRSLEEIDAIFSQDNAGWFNIVKLEREYPRIDHTSRDGEKTDISHLEKKGLSKSEAKAMIAGPDAVSEQQIERRE